MAWTEADRVKIRSALGAGAVYLQQFPRLEAVITAVQSVADGGSRPDNSTETAIRANLANIDTLNQRLSALWGQAQVGDAKGVSLDAARGAAMLRMEGRRQVHLIAAALSIRPLRDVFSSSALDDDGADWSDGRSVYRN